jgi:hypothetical protein
MTETRQCWAYGPNGRCHHPAGHPGDHIIEITWTDDQCVTPGVPTLGQSQPAPAMTDVSYAVVQDPVHDEPEPCVACNHMHKSGACKCGCYEHI